MDVNIGPPAAAEFDEVAPKFAKFGTTRLTRPRSPNKANFGPAAAPDRPDDLSQLMMFQELRDVAIEPEV